MGATKVDGYVRFDRSTAPTNLRLAGTIDTVGFRKEMLDVIGAEGYLAHSRISIRV